MNVTPGSFEVTVEGSVYKIYYVFDTTLDAMKDSMRALGVKFDKPVELLPDFSFL